MEVERYIVSLEGCQVRGESSRAIGVAASASAIMSFLQSMRSKGPNVPELQMDYPLNTVLWYIVVVEQRIR